ncbi:DUF3850 domain-containing protein [Leclercia pneumoniae]|uniref:DUF3850 domain-containing protein n=1 Tax=Leclercia pneumoniae TaxID=2815358 RepID=UPI0030CD7C1F
MSKTHDLEILPSQFEVIRSGHKKCLYRLNELDYARGDILRLHEWEPENGYTGQRVSASVTNVTDLNEWEDNYVMLSLQLMEQGASEGMRLLNWKELSDKGLVFRINHEILHPLGLAVGYESTNGVSAGAFVADDGVWQYSDELVAQAQEKGWIK